MVLNRRNDVHINRGYTHEDELAYNLPASYRFEQNPLNVTIVKPFGRFTAIMNWRETSSFIKESGAD